MADSSDIDAALVVKLSSDAALLAICTNGVHVDVPPVSAVNYVLVSLVDEVDEAKFGGRAYEDALYMVQAVMRWDKDHPAPNIKGAAARIDVLLEDQPLTVSGYSWMTMHRESRIRATEVDDVDTSIKVLHRGGNYRVQMSLT